MIAVVTRDLMIISRIRGAAAAQNLPLTVVDSLGAVGTVLATAPVVGVLVDLQWPGLSLDQLNQLVATVRATRPGDAQPEGNAPTSPPVIGWAQHVREDLLEMGVAAGLDQVLPRGQFDKQLRLILGRLAGG